ncbi:HAD-like domain-containing protein, partial [Coemansia spiralis]
VLALDFDMTLTISDTISNVAETARRKNPEYRDFQWFVNEYIKDHRTFYTQWEPQIAEHRTKGTVDRSFMDKYLEALRPVETASLDRINRHGILANVTRAEFAAAGRDVQFRPGATTFINHFIHCSYNCSICVVSVNWSKDFIHGALSANGVDTEKGRISIYANDMEFGSTGLSTGRLAPKLVVAKDKGEVVEGFKREVTEEHGCNPLVVYAGDSPTDLPALLDADVGLLIGDNSSPI